MGQIDFTIALVSIGLFAIAIIGFSVNFAADNNTNVSISNDPEINNLNNKIQGNVSAFDTGSESTYKSIVETSIDTGGQTTRTGGAYAITPLSIINIVQNILKVGYIKIFGTGAGFGIFLTTFLGMLIFIAGLYIVKTWIGGNPN